jgi:ATP-dependent DNA ligase
LAAAYLMLRRYGETAKEEGARRADELEAPAVLSRVHWVRPELVVEVKYLSWTDDNLLRERPSSSIGVRLTRGLIAGGKACLVVS